MLSYGQQALSPKLSRECLARESISERRFDAPKVVVERCWRKSIIFKNINPANGVRWILISEALMAIYIKNRKTNELYEEKVEGERFLKWLYDKPVGVLASEALVKRKWLSCLYGRMQDTTRSAKKIKPFVERHAINLSESEKTAFETFNDFFTRRLKPGARPIEGNENRLISPADGRLLAFENIDVDSVVQIKGMVYRLADLFESPERAALYQKGTHIVVRLSPVDYHRFHFPAGGRVKSISEVDGRYYSVNPIALKKKFKLYVENKRTLTTVESDVFGDYEMVEVGATFVGSIVQNVTAGVAVKRGEEKGFFKFGGSTVILFFREGQLQVDADILQNSSEGYETKVLMGEGIGFKK